MTEKTAAENLLDSAKAKLQEGADRARAAGHEAAHAVTGDLTDKAKAVADRARAEGHNAQAHAEYNEGKRELNED